MTRIKSLINKKNTQRATGIIVVIILAIVGVHLLTSSHAQTPYVSVTAASGNITSPATSQACSGATADRCVKFGSSSLYSVSGTQILSSGSPYLPYGVTVYGLSDSGWQTSSNKDILEIAAIAGFWHGNTVRIQVAPSILDAGTTGYLSAIENEVSTAETAGLNVIISAQYERTTKIAGPDSTTVSFWQTIAPIYAKDPHVWFDLFNEPTESCGTLTQTCWDTWKNGNTKYVGMQTLVNDIRSAAPSNLILVEGLEGAKTLSGITPDLLTTSNDTNIVYEVHPYFNGAGYETPANWANNWGNLASQIPVLAGEWGEFGSSSQGECQTSAPTLVPTFLNYINSLHIGLIAFTLDTGNMIRAGNLTSPTEFDAGVPFVCKNDTSATAQGDGGDILNVFTNKGTTTISAP